MMENWKQRALADPDLTDKQYCLMKLGPSTLAEAFMLQALKWKYQIRGMTH